MRILARAIRRSFGTTTTVEKTTLGTITSYYDSQSGQHVRYSDAIQIHCIGAPAAGVRGLASVTLPSPATLPATVAARIYLTSPLPAHDVALSVSCTTGRESWDTVLAAASAATSAQRAVKVVLSDAMVANPYDVQLLGSLLADSGATVLTLDAGNESDTDVLEEVFEALTWSDVAGLPMKQRIGLRASDEGLLEFAVTGLLVKHFDVCCTGTHGPRPATVAGILDAAQIAHTLCVE
ncbi:hypothetical protein ACHHYP_14785 [Achlya hypogyna]|uniref:Uncharacterized protein n=1 Tax=Achlya hypogyna TaxID=1202772 RepID=A0A1V9YCB7_ACHHY|nr:hypothetical protein ACHHYP_14785 [Achlya hypogyna]